MNLSLTLSLNANTLLKWLCYVKSVEPCFSVSSFTKSFVICQPRYSGDTSVENVIVVIV